MTYLIVRVETNEAIESLKRKDYINSLYDTTNSYINEDGSIGFFKKFSYSLGFKPYDGHYHITPDRIISDNFYAYPKGDIMFEFYIKKGVTTSPDDSFSYGNGTIARKWANFLSKIYPHLSVSIHVNQDLPSRKILLTSFLFKSIEESPVTIETSISEELNEDEIQSLSEIVKLYESYPLKFKLLQFHCSTCEGYDSESPIHLELLYSYNDIKRVCC